MTTTNDSTLANAIAEYAAANPDRNGRNDAMTIERRLRARMQIGGAAELRQWQRIYSTSTWEGTYGQLCVSIAAQLLTEIEGSAQPTEPEAKPDQAPDTFTEAQATAYAAYVAESIADLRSAATTSAFMNLIRVLTPRADSDAVLARAHAEISAARPATEALAEVERLDEQHARFIDRWHARQTTNNDHNADHQRTLCRIRLLRPYNGQLERLQAMAHAEAGTLAAYLDALTITGRALNAQIGSAEDRKNHAKQWSREYFKAHDEVTAATWRHQQNLDHKTAALQVFNQTGGSYDALKFAILPTIPAALSSGLPEAEPTYDAAYYAAADLRHAREMTTEHLENQIKTCEAYNAHSQRMGYAPTTYYTDIIARYRSVIAERNAKPAYCDYCAEAISGDHYQDVQTIACLSCQRRYEANATEERAAEDAKNSGPTLGELFRSVSSSDDNANAIYDSLYPDQAAVDTGTMHGPNDAELLRAAEQDAKAADLRDLQVLADANDWTAFDAARDEYAIRWTTDREMVREIFIAAKGPRRGRVVVKTAVIGRFPASFQVQAEHEARALTIAEINDEIATMRYELPFADCEQDAARLRLRIKGFQHVLNEKAAELHPGTISGKGPRADVTNPAYA